jgi:hypothetical protein
MSLTGREKAVAGSLLLLLAYPAWVRGGTYNPIQWPLPWLAMLLLCVLAVTLVVGKTDAHRLGVRGAMKYLRADPIWWVGLLLLGLLAVQWLNTGRTLQFDFREWKWIYGPPPVPWLPSSLKAEEGLEMLYWFFPAWVAVLVVRLPLLRRRALRFLTIMLAVNAGILALFGIVQFASGTDSIYWLHPLPVHFFASFGYPHHAGAYFILLMALSLGLVFYALFGHHRRRRLLRSIVFGVCALLCLIGANLTFSLACIALSWLVVLAAVVLFLARIWNRLRRGQRITTIAGLCAILVLGVMLVMAAASGAQDTVSEELSDLERSDFIRYKLSKRVFLVDKALEIWADHPWFGVGGWGYRYLLGVYLEPDQWDLIERGRANVHNDPAQFLAEFGLFGASMLLAAILALAWPMVRGHVWKHPIATMPLIGLSEVLRYSIHGV